jgi:hypothetical protein
MELMQIIYSVVIYGGGLFLLFLLFVYQLSKVRNHNTHRIANTYDTDPQTAKWSQLNQQRSMQKQIETQAKSQSEQNELRNKAELKKPVIFQLDQQQPRELKIIRKSTFRDETGRFRSTDENIKNGNGKRYTIVNDEQNKIKNRASNLYL